MNHKKINTFFSVQLIEYLGPSIVLLTLLFCFLFGLTFTVYWGAVALLGTLLSSFGKGKGFLLSCILIIATESYLYRSLSIHERFLHVGLGLAFALSFLIIFLCSEEIEAIVNSWQEQARSRLDTLKHLDGKLKEVQDLCNEYEKQSDLMNQSKNSITSEHKSRLNEKNEMIQQMQHEINRLLTEIENIRKRNSDKTQTILKLQSALEAAEKNVKNLDSESLVNQQELDRLKKEQSDQSIQTKEIKIKLSALQQENESLKEKQSDSIQTVPSEIRRLKGLYHELRGQFEEKKAVLEQTRKELFIANEKMACMEKRFNEEKQTLEESMLLQTNDLLRNFELKEDKSKQEHQAEIQSLETLVENLMTQTPSRS